ncbi:DUF2155 domain-containing protein [Candidatus Pelagibacter bacterium]|nr:DUF2155 domain-containing protein [Candidatus Pelagibacter bacterium]MDA9624879.1 DUF2155 domain-containing protein [Candidatus Pelagibacter bacterium]
MINLKNIIHGNKKIIIVFFSFLLNSTFIAAEDKIISSPLINLDKIKPSFEEIENSNNDNNAEKFIQNKKKTFKKSENSAKFIGLDKITAKTSEIILIIGEAKKFGPLEIKVLKCGKVNSGNLVDNTAYLQVKDLSENQNEKVFIFNGWTFASDPSLAPFDHAIYDLQLVACNTI